MSDVPGISPSLLRPGARAVVEATARSLRALDRHRATALAVAGAMLLVLLAPWYEVTATAPGVHGTRHTLHQSLSGWQALSGAGIVSALVAVAALVWLLARGAATVEGLGAPARRTARIRVDGGLVAAGGALAALLELIGLAVHPGPRVTLAGVSSAASVRFGLVLALLLAVTLSALGVRMALAAGGDAPARPRPRPPGSLDLGLPRRAR